MSDKPTVIVPDAALPHVTLYAYTQVYDSFVNERAQKGCEITLLD